MTLEAKFNLYRTLIKEQQDEHGFLPSFGCDSLLFSCLVGCVPGINVNVWAAFDGEKWHRRPVSQGCCYPKESASTTSRDMLVGLLFFAYVNKDLAISESIISYALKHFGVMGKGPLSRTLMTPSLLSTAAWVSYRLGGPSRAWLRWIPYIGSKNVADYQAHIQVLHLLLRQRLGATRSVEASTCYGYHEHRQFRNGLFLYACDYRYSAHATIEHALEFPVGRLPTSADRKEGWLWQRDYGPDWLPAEGPVKYHTGGDFLFLYALLNGMI